MQLRHLRTLIPPSDKIFKLSGAAWSPNGLKFAIANADRIIILFDENGEKKDKFATKPADANTGKNYTVTGLAFSPDSTKIAIAQSDWAVFVYRIGSDWGEKKSICNKFILPVQVTCLTWPKDQFHSLFFGLADGKVVIGNLKSNKPTTLYQTENNSVTCISASLTGNGIVSGHADGSIQMYMLDKMKPTLLEKHQSIPTAITWSIHSIVVSDIAKTITFMSMSGQTQQQFVYGTDEPETLVMTTSPTGTSILAGSINKMRMFSYATSKQQWIETASPFIIDDYLSVTALSFKPDGSRILMGSITGELDMFDICLKRTRYKTNFEFTYLSPTQVIVKTLSSGTRILLKSIYDSEFTKINIFQDQYLVAYTQDTLCLGDLMACKLSEIKWDHHQGIGSERFLFTYPGICMIMNVGELVLVEYGINDILGCCRTEFISPHLISVRLNERHSNTRKLAFLIDPQSIQIMDLARDSHHAVHTVNHTTRIDWLELSGKANRLLFRDTRKHLHLFNAQTQDLVTLLTYCPYVQWVPNSDVIVAQSRNSLYVYYNINSPDTTTVHLIQGDVMDISRENGVTNVIVDEGIANRSYTLDESLIEFGTAMDDLDWARALYLLEPLQLTPETECMWSQLGNVALQYQKIALAERCFAAVGNSAKAMYMRELNGLVNKVKKEDPMLVDPTTHYSIRAKLAVLEKDFKGAEQIYLEQGQVQAAMDMYQELHQWDASIKVAEQAHHPDVGKLRSQYFDWLISSGQESKAADVRKSEGNWTSAIQLYLKAGMPSSAAMLIKQHNLHNNTDLVERTANALTNAGSWEKAGELFLAIGQKDRALDAFEKGHCYKAAIELCRTYEPSKVVQLEAQWGNYLVSTRQLESAIHHFIEGNENLKALETAVMAKSWTKAASIVDSCDLSDPSVQKICLDLANHFKDLMEFPKAEKYFIKAGNQLAAIQMYNSLGQWDKGHQLALTVMTAEQVFQLYTQLAHEKESAGELRHAEKMYLLLDQPDLAINMYKNVKDYERMVQLVAVYHKDLLNETHVFLGKTLESGHDFRQAEHHFLQANDWKSVINMYCTNHLYEDAYRVAKIHGGQYAAKQVAYLWARSLGGDAGAKLLMKHELLEYAIDFAAENATFEFAFELCKHSNKTKEADVYLKKAMYLEDEGKFQEAETCFIKANKPKEAILMHIHNQNWDAAQSVAETHDPSAVGDILCGRAKMLFGKGDTVSAEAMCLQAHRPESMLAMYKEAGKWADMLRFAKEYLPARVAQIAAEHDLYMQTRSDLAQDDLVSTARMLEQQGQPVRAMDVYLRVSASLPQDIQSVAIPAWIRAAELALKLTPGQKAQSVAKSVAEKLALVGNRFDSAGDVLALAELYRDACDVYAKGGHWDKCKQLGQLQPTLQKYIDTLYVDHLKQTGAVDTLVSLDVNAACQIHAGRGDWDQCLQVAASSKDLSVMQQQLMAYANAMMSLGTLDKLVARLVQYGAPTTQGFLDLYQNIVYRLLSDMAEKTNKVESNTLEIILSARELLKKLYSSLGPALSKGLKTLMYVCHYQYMSKYCQKIGTQLAGSSSQSSGTTNVATQGPGLMLQYAAKQLISLLRYSECPTPMDLALYSAGIACRDAGMDQWAFTFMNRFLDLSDAIDEQDDDALVSLQSNTEFSNESCDIPQILKLPKTHSIPTDQREHVRDWVLNLSLQRRFQAVLDTRTCDQCQNQLYWASLNCPRCSYMWDPCIVTGFPVLSHLATKCQNCNMPANKEDWNRIVMQEKKCPWCLTAQGLSYSLKNQK